jgi:hypothetical protein
MTSHHTQNFRKSGAAVRSESDPSIYQTVENVDPCQIAYSSGQLFSACGGARRLQIYKVEGTWAISLEKRAKAPFAASFFGFSSNFWKGLADGASDA